MRAESIPKPSLAVHKSVCYLQSFSEVQDHSFIHLFTQRAFTGDQVGDTELDPGNSYSRVQPAPPGSSRPGPQRTGMAESWDRPGRGTGLQARRTFRDPYSES